MDQLAMSAVEIAVVISVVTLASCVQGAIGFGMALIASPLLVLIEPRLIPGPLMASGLIMAIGMALRDREHADLTNVRWSILGYAFGAPLGAAVLVTLDPSVFAIVFGVLVLLGVVLSALGLHVAVTARSATGAGLLGGFMSTTCGIGGPPMALVYQHSQAASFRGTLAAYFIASVFLGIIVLTIFGRFGIVELKLAMMLAPAQLLGFLLSGALTRRLGNTSIRPFILGLSSVAACAVILRVLL